MIVARVADSRFRAKGPTLFTSLFLVKVEGALLELSRKQAELESREQQLAETAGAYLGASASPTNTALVPGMQG